MVLDAAPRLCEHFVIPHNRLILVLQHGCSAQSHLLSAQRAPSSVLERATAAQEHRASADQARSRRSAPQCAA